MPPQETPRPRASAAQTDPASPRTATDRLLHAAPLPRSRRAWAGALAVFGLALLLRLWGLGAIDELIFDETYYVKDAHTIVQHGVEMDWPDGADQAFEAGNVDSYEDSGAFVVHPPAGKWIIGLGMLVLGADNPWGWRISVALLGSFSVLMLARIGRRLLRSTGIGLLAALFLAIDGLHITHSRTSLLDLMLSFFVLAAFGALLIDRDRFRARLSRLHADALASDTAVSALGFTGGWRPWRLAAGVLLGVACSVKWSGVFFLAVFGIMTVLWDWWARRRLREQRWLANGFFRDAVPAFFAMVGSALVVYVASWAGWFASERGYYRNWAEQNGYADGNPLLNALRSLWHYHGQIYTFHRGVDAEHTYAASPFGWLLQIRPTNFFYRSYEYGQAGCEVGRCAAQVLSVGNPLIWWLGAIAVLVALVAGIGWRDGRAWAALSGLIAGYLPWFMYLDRTIFTFYAVAFAPWLMLCLAYAIGLLVGGSRADPERKLAGILFAGSLVTLMVLVSAFFWPVWSGQTIDLGQWQWRMWLPTWP